MDAVMHHELNGLESAVDRMIADRDRLQAINAELVEALEYYAAMKGPTGWPARNALEHHRAALSKAKES